MPIKWMPEESAWKFLSSQTEGRLATCGQAGEPYITSVNHLVHERRIYFHCRLTGRKLENIQANPRVCFETSCGEIVAETHQSACGYTTRYNSVQAFGEARIVSGNARKAELLNLLAKRLAAGKQFPPISEDQATKCAVVEIAVDRISGKMNVDAE